MLNHARPGTKSRPSAVLWFRATSRTRRPWPGRSARILQLSLAEGGFTKSLGPYGTTAIRLRFTAPPGSTWRIDDVDVDPRMKG